MLESLDNPIWFALTTEHRVLAQLHGLARRYPPDVSPLAALLHPTNDAFDDLQRLVSPREHIALFTASPLDVPGDWQVDRLGDVLRAWLDYGKSKTGEEKAHSSLEGDRSRAKVHLIFWNDRVAKDIQPLKIQAWLDGKSVGIRSKLRNEMSAVYRHGQATGLIPRGAEYNPSGAEYNPMSLVSAPTRSDFESVDLSPSECSAILEKIEEPIVRVLVVVVAVTGARASEVLGLRWADLDFKKGRIHIRRAWKHGKLGKPKSRLSRRPVPMVTGLATLMEAWTAETMYSSDMDFIFPSIKLGGRQPRTGGILVTDYIHPAAVATDVLELRDGVRYYDGEPVRRFGLHSMRHGTGHLVGRSWSASERDPAYAAALFAEHDDAPYSQ